MKDQLARIAMRKAIGVYVGERQVTVSHVAATPWGPVEVCCRSEGYAPEQLPDVVGRLLKPLLGKRKRRPPVAVGMSALRVFFSTRPIRDRNTDASARVLLHEVLQSPNICIDDMVVEVIKAEVGKRKLASIVSCRKKYLTAVLETLEACRVRPFRAEPAPCALLRSAARCRRAPRRAKVVLRVFLGDRQGLAVVMAGALTVLWRFFDLPPDAEPQAICSAARSVGALIVHCGIDSSPDVVILHGRADLRARLEAEEFRQMVGTPLVWSGGPELNDAAVAFGLALGCLGQQSSDDFDLSRTLKPRLPLWEVLPWGEIAVQAALVLCMAMFLLMRSRGVEDALAPIQTEYAKHAWLGSKPEAEFQKEREDLEQKVNAIRKFVSSRITWTVYTHDLSARLPPEVSLTSFHGVCELEGGGKKASMIKPKKQFTIRAATPIASDGSIPKEVDDFLTALKGDPLLKRDFPIVELLDLKRFQPNRSMPANALFTVVCLPKATSAPPKAADDKGKPHADKAPAEKE